MGDKSPKNVKKAKQQKGAKKSVPAAVVVAPVEVRRGQAGPAR